MRDIKASLPRLRGPVVVTSIRDLRRELAHHTKRQDARYVFSVETDVASLPPEAGMRKESTRFRVIKAKVGTYLKLRRTEDG